ncbi:MAG: glycosyltransferase [Acidobacteriota bacterium]
MPAVSVIMPAYNVEPYIGEAIRSVLAQTFADLELLVVDDGATDGSAAIAEAWTARDSRVRVVRQANAGISAARNHGLRLSRGRCLAILDSDDGWDPHYLQAQMAILEARPDVDIVTGNARFLGSSLDGRPARPWPDPRPAPTLAGLLQDETAVFIMSVFRRRVYEATGGFDEALRTNEDYDFWLRAARAGFTFQRNDRPLGFYRRRDDSLSASDLRMLPGIIAVYRKVRPALAGHPRELAIVDAQIARFETECMAADARGAIETGDFASASHHLAALHRRRGGAALRIASLMSRWTPTFFSGLYGVRRVRLALSRLARHRMA